MGNEENNAEIRTLCDRVKLAVSVGDTIDEEMMKHIEECDECRTFFEQSQIITKKLAEIGEYSFTRNGKSVADTVMDEIRRQELFTKGTPLGKKKSFFVRHSGMLAACLAISVMAIPFARGYFANKSGSAYENADLSVQSVNDAVSEDGNAENALYTRSDEKASYRLSAGSGAVTLTADDVGAEQLPGASFTTLGNSAETVPTEQFVEKSSAYVLTNDEYSDIDFDEDSLIETALGIFDGDDLDTTELAALAEVVMLSNDRAEVTFTVAEGETLTVTLEKAADKWQILS